MKFRNRVVNPVVRLLLGSPLHRLVSSSLVTPGLPGSYDRPLALPALH